MFPKTIIWKSEGVAGEERLRLTQNGDEIIATSRAAGGDADLHTEWDAEYVIACDKSWHVRRVSIREKLQDCRLDIFSKGNGHWTDADGNVLAALAGCIDIDFRATPYSNTFPIRRLHLPVGESAAIDVAYINAPDLVVTREHQVYTRTGEHEWKFAQPSADFEAVITVDNEGFVVDYPGLFRRAHR